MSDSFELEICQGKYHYRYEAGKQEVLRNGEPWPAMNDTLIGNKFVFSMAVELDEAIKERNALRTDKATLQQMTYSLKDHLEAAKTAWKEADKACCDLTEKVIPNLRESLEAAEKERDWHAERCEDAMNECAALRAKIEQMEKQEPVAWMNSRNGFICKENKNPDYNVPLAPILGAKGE
jgi:hypothetical protein